MVQCPECESIYTEVICKNCGKELWREKSSGKAFCQLAKPPIGKIENKNYDCIPWDVPCCTCRAWLTSCCTTDCH